MPFRQLLAAVLAVALTSTACTTMKTIRPAIPGERPFGPIEAGDLVVVHTSSGEEARFVVQGIDGTVLVGPNGRRYERADLVRIERKTFSGARTAGLVAGIAGGVFLAVAIAVGNWLSDNTQ